VVAFTKDWHPENHISFAKNHVGHNIFDTIEVFAFICVEDLG